MRGRGEFSSKTRAIPPDTADGTSDAAIAKEVVRQVFEYLWDRMPPEERDLICLGVPVKMEFVNDRVVVRVIQPAEFYSEGG